jgi:hypothetical protein
VVKIYLGGNRASTYVKSLCFELTELRLLRPFSLLITRKTARLLTSLHAESHFLQKGGRNASITY